ncbi:hypothetical protein JTE90_014799 [Oedothorax gibbosus]|uniref:Uncharacterized protein n=1 Tax=Oedothorax gibbosus TaxID=931172 RepID=A0AAV6TET2_9ARAC|nr:hypothetical protein JTE90_014799 [Oedothorax gibbosus]
MNAAERLFDHVQRVAPETHLRILQVIRPHSLAAVTRIFQQHLVHSVPDLRVFQQNSKQIPEFCLQFVLAIRRQFPSPGDPFGILLTCRITKSDTQGTLDSKHLQIADPTVSYNVDKALRYELNLFTIHTHVFEMATTHQYASVFTKNYNISELMDLLPNSGVLERGEPFHKGRDVRGRLQYLSTFQFILVPNRIIYKSFKDLQILLQQLKLDRIVAFSDIRNIFQKCGLVCYFFNLVNVVQHQLLTDMSCVYARDVLTIMKYQCRTGTPLPLTREGLSKNPDRSPIDVLSFEAPKKNYARMCTEQPKRSFPVMTSADKIFFGQQFNEGTGYHFGLMPKKGQ